MYLGIQFDGVLSTSHVAKNFMGTGLDGPEGVPAPSPPAAPPALATSPAPGPCIPSAAPAPLIVLIILSVLCQLSTSRRAVASPTVTLRTPLRSWFAARTPGAVLSHLVDASNDRYFHRPINRTAHPRIRPSVRSHSVVTPQQQRDIDTWPSVCGSSGSFHVVSLFRDEIFYLEYLPVFATHH